MLQCREVVDQCGDLVDGELGLAARLRVRAHLLMCRHCRLFVRQFRLLLVTLARNEPEDPVPEGFADRVIVTLRADAVREPDHDLHHFG